MGFDLIQAIAGAFAFIINVMFLWINALVYDFINVLYQIYIALASAQIFNVKTVQEISNRISQ